MSRSCVDICETIFEAMCGPCPFREECHPEPNEHDDSAMFGCLNRAKISIEGGRPKELHRKAWPYNYVLEIITGANRLRDHMIAHTVAEAVGSRSEHSLQIKEGNFIPRVRVLGGEYLVELWERRPGSC